MIGNNNKSSIDDISKFFNDFEFVLDNLNEIVWVISWPDLKVEFISKAVKDIVGYSVGEFKEDSMLLQKITHPADKGINNRALENLKATGFSEREIRIITKNGNIKWVHDKCKMIYDEENNPIRVEGIMSDITCRKKDKEKLKYNENRYQTLFNSAPIGFVLEDEKGNILEMNETLCEELGYSKEELV